MKTKNHFLLPALIAALNLLPASRVSAQIFTTLHSFTAYPERTNPDGANPYAGLLTNSSGDILYGTARGGGSSGKGTVFAVNTNGTGFTTLHSFTGGSDGANPYTGLISFGNTLYGTAHSGGGSDKGTVFTIHTDGTGFTILHSFTGGSDGANPFAGLVLSGNTLYGTAYGGGSSNKGTVFAVQTDGTGFTILHNFAGGSDGANPYAGLILSGNTLYGTAWDGGSSGNGTVFKVNTDGTGFTALHSFSGSDGGNPNAGLIVSGNILYGTAVGGDWGTVFALNIDGTGFTNLHYFEITDGAFPYAGLILSGNTLYGTASYGGGGGGGGGGTVFAINLNGAGFTNLHSFAYYSSDGASPYAGLTISGGTLYGTASEGDSSTAGTVFAVNTDGMGFTNLHRFTALSDPVYTNSDGAYPLAGLIANASGTTLYGTAQRGGSSGQGTVFAVNTDGSGFTTLHSFTSLNNNANSDGAFPEAGVTLSGNTLYGVAPSGGSSGNGTVFAVHTGGSGFTTLHSFTATVSSTNSDGANPAAGLIVFGDALFGAAGSGGSSGRGTVFKLNTDGSGFTNLHSFTALDPSTGFNSEGAGPNGLILSGNTLYGTTYSGGSSGYGTVFAVKTNGTGFTALHSFTANPTAALIVLGDTLFGTTVSGGTGGGGTVFAVNTGGTGFTNLHNFTNNSSDGSFLRAGLTLAGNTLYGAAGLGGSFGIGTVFALNTDGTGFTKLHNFSGSSNGGSPVGRLIVSGNSLYGMAYPGSSSGNGTVFSLSFPLPQLTITPSGTTVILTWPANVAGFDYTGYRLQKANAITGPFADVPGATSPYFIPITSPRQFFRLVQ